MRKPSRRRLLPDLPPGFVHASMSANQGVASRVEESGVTPGESRPLVMGGASMLSGICHGGPFSGKMNHHGFPIYAIGRDRLSKRLIIGWQGGPTADVEVGHYEWSGGAWHWHSPEA